MIRRYLLWLLLGMGLANAPAAGDGISLPLLSPRTPVDAKIADRWSWNPGGGAPLRPLAIDAHPTGVIAGIEVRRHRIFLTGADGGWIGFAELPPGQLRFGFFEHLFARSGLHVFALDPEQWIIDSFDLRGAWVGRLDLEETGDEIGDPSGFCLDRSGDLYVLDAARGRILTFNRQGMPLRTLEAWADWQPTSPIDLEIDGQGRLYLLESRPPLIHIIDTSGQRIGQAPLAPESEPVAMAVDTWGNAFVADGARGDIHVLPAGEGEAWWIGRAEDEDWEASDLAIAESNRLLVADASHACVWVFSLRYDDPETRPRAR